MPGGDGYACYDGLSGIDIREVYLDLVPMVVDVNHPFVGFAEAGLCPKVKVADDCAVVDGHVKQTQTLAVGCFAAATAIPRFDEV